MSRRMGGRRQGIVDKRAKGHVGHDFRRRLMHYLEVGGRLATMTAANLTVFEATGLTVSG